MSDRLPLTSLAHAAWEKYVGQGSSVVDATAGNGADTLWLAGRVGPTGTVYAIDIQAPALEITRTRLEVASYLGRVRTFKGNHADMDALIPPGETGRIHLVCFNLGYLPGGDHAVRTDPGTTATALGKALGMLSGRGALSVIAYRNHPGAMEEFQVVDAFMSQLAAPWRCLVNKATGSADNPGPVWWLVAQG